MSNIRDLATHPDPNVSPRQLADYWGKDIETIHRWIRKGALRARKVGTGPPACQSWLIWTKDALEFERWPELDAGGKAGANHAARMPTRTP